MVTINGNAYALLNGGLVAKLQETMGVLKDVETTAMQEVFNYAAPEVERLTQKYIREEVTGTKSGPGRVKSGDMWRSVRVSRFWGGFVAAWEDFKPYFAFQERGFPHAASGRFIPGMRAFEFAKRLMDEVVSVTKHTTVAVTRQQISRIWSNMNLWRASSSGPGTRVSPDIRRKFYEAVNGRLNDGAVTPRRIFGGN